MSAATSLSEAGVREVFVLRGDSRVAVLESSFLLLSVELWRCGTFPGQYGSVDPGRAHLLLSKEAAQLGDRSTGGADGSMLIQ